MERFKIIGIILNQIGDLEYVLDQDADTNKKFKKPHSKLIIGTNGTFYTCYKYQRPFGRFKAFGGRNFEIKLSDGSIEHCNGQWWDDGHSELEKIENVKLTQIGWSTPEEMKKYKSLFYSGYVCEEKLNKMVAEYYKKGGVLHKWNELVNV